MGSLLVNEVERCLGEGCRGKYGGGRAFELHAWAVQPNDCATLLVRRHSYELMVGVGLWGCGRGW